MPKAEQNTQIAIKWCESDKARCSYQCPFYQDGPVMSWCWKYDTEPKYDGQIPPLRVAGCIRDNDTR